MKRLSTAFSQKESSPLSLYKFVFVHDAVSADNALVMSQCPYYTSSNDDSDRYGSITERQWRVDTKYGIYDVLHLDANIQRESISMSRFMYSDDNDNAKRKPDLYFADHDGHEFVIELYRSWLTPVAVMQREQFFRECGINLIWLFPDCDDSIKGSQNIASYILYGSNSGAYELQTNHQRPSNNFFSFGESDLLKSELKNTVWLTVNYPVITKQVNSNVGVVMHERQMRINNLSLCPRERLPIGVNTGTNIAGYRSWLAKRLRAVHYGAQLTHKYTDVRFTSLQLLSVMKGVIAEYELMPSLNGIASKRGDDCYKQITNYVNRYEPKVVNKERRHAISSLLRSYRNALTDIHIKLRGLWCISTTDNWSSDQSIAVKELRRNVRQLNKQIKADLLDVKLSHRTRKSLDGSVKRVNAEILKYVNYPIEQKRRVEELTRQSRQIKRTTRKQGFSSNLLKKDSEIRAWYPTLSMCVWGTIFHEKYICELESVIQYRTTSECTGEVELAVSALLQQFSECLSRRVTELSTQSKENQKRYRVELRRLSDTFNFMVAHDLFNDEIRDDVSNKLIRLKNICKLL
ncbi:hypothetical protein [Photobacterium phosphoreum]|nr:hypothetical protein [Photobacterium phosphoreum]MCD9477227.1 hypothetical protein [Photobacterium phosphoreum]MCF2178052.1 hypothetical protein [Photobacterium phosphoreum]